MSWWREGLHGITFWIFLQSQWQWRSVNLLWPDPIWTDSSLVPQSSVPWKTWPAMSQSIRELKCGYSPRLMKPAPRPRYTTSGPRPKQTAMFIMRERKHPNVRTCHAKRQLRHVSENGSLFSPQLQNRLQLGGNNSIEIENKCVCPMTNVPSNGTDKINNIISVFWSYSSPCTFIHEYCK